MTLHYKNNSQHLIKVMSFVTFDFIAELNFISQLISLSLNINYLGYPLNKT